MKRSTILSCLLAASLAGAADVRIVVQADSGRRPISPWLYGRNNNLSDDAKKPTADKDLALYREAGLRMLRENGGNNATKYNWRRKLSSHPDWYDNVYAHDWDYVGTTLQQKLPGTQGLLAFQLLGWAAASDTANFPDYNFQKTWDAANHADTLWKGRSWTDFGAAAQDLAGGGVVDTVIHVVHNDWGDSYRMDSALAKGDPSKYLMPWPADSSTGIVDHWFGAGGLGLDSSRFRYWSMDNEPDIWSGTHNDVTDTIPFEAYFQKYLAVAKAVRRKSSTIKLVGPVIANEWQWWTWNNKVVNDKGVKRSAMEMFLKRIGEEEKASGLRLLDVFDLHFYPNYNDASNIPDLLQTDRMFFDTTYAWPGSNGIHMYDNQWGAAVPNFLFERVRRWMVLYLGQERGFSLTEFGAMKAGGDIDARDVAYASWIGSFADHGGEILTAWDWYPGWWEVLHLFSRYAQTTRVASNSSRDSVVSAYSSISSAGDSMTVVLINRNTGSPLTVSVNMKGFHADPSATTLQLSGLVGETFKSHSNNALKAGVAAVAGDSLSVTVPAKGIVGVVLTGAGTAPNAVGSRPARRDPSLRWTGSVLEIRGTSIGGSFEIRDVAGTTLRRGRTSAGSTRLDARNLPRGLLLVRCGSWSGTILHSL